MTLDEQLRATLQQRAGAVPLPADPFAGVERRVRGLRRRRAYAGSAATAVAVAAIVSAVPALTPDRTAAPGPGDVATSAAPSPVPAASRYALDATTPWDYRGVALTEQDRDGLLAAWQARHAGGSVTPLFGQVWEPSRQLEVVFADFAGDRWATAQASAATGGGTTWRFREHDLPQEQVLALTEVLGADEGGLRGVVVSSPLVERIAYAPDGSLFRDVPSPASGIGVLAVEQTQGSYDQVQAVGPGGELVLQQGVPDAATPDDGAAQAAGPGNLVGWRSRGAVEGDLLQQARQTYALTRQVPADQVDQAVLAAGSEGGRRYLLGQFWLPDDEVADTFGVVLRSGQDPEPQLYRPLAVVATLTAMFLSPADEQSRGALVVVPAPGTGEVLYRGAAGAPFTSHGSAQDGRVVVLARDEQAERGQAQDAVRLLDTGGRTRSTTPVFDLLCGKTSCG